MADHDLHNAIMNLQAPAKTRSELDGAPKGFYLLGFRDARHAAAELALASPPVAVQEEGDALIDMPFRKRIARLLAEMHGDEILSEQQCAKLFGTDLVSWRCVEQSFTFGASMCEFDAGSPQAMPDTSPVEDAILAAMKGDQP